jgi:hypothetical protein
VGMNASRSTRCRATLLSSVTSAISTPSSAACTAPPCSAAGAAGAREGSTRWRGAWHAWKRPEIASTLSERERILRFVMFLQDFRHLQLAQGSMWSNFQLRTIARITLGQQQKQSAAKLAQQWP